MMSSVLDPIKYFRVTKKVKKKEKKRTKKKKKEEKKTEATSSLPVCIDSY